MISAAVGGVAGWSINKYEARRPSGEIYYTPSGDKEASRVRDTMPKAGNHFTSYQADQYPDLTYAAENADMRAGRQPEIMQYAHIQKHILDILTYAVRTTKSMDEICEFCQTQKGGQFRWSG